MIPDAIRTATRLMPWTLRLVAGSAVYRMRKVTPTYAYQALIQLFCLTRGRSNDLLARLVAMLRPPYRLPPAAGVLGTLGPTELERITGVLRARGYYVFERRLPPDLCARLLEFALTNPCSIRPGDDDTSGGGARVTVYNRAAPEGIIYEFDPESAVNHPDVQALMADPSVVAVAQAYIGSQPVLDEVNLWWSTGHGRKADANAAQLFHFDMDRIRWLKFFMYLTDVGPDNGPHCFVAGSHRSGGIPSNFLSRGYVRLLDEEVRAQYPASAFVELVGPAGTVFAEDTRGLHKGKPVLVGDRLVLEFEFSNTMFGATPLKISRLRALLDPQLKAFVARYRRMYARWLGASL